MNAFLPDYLSSYRLASAEIYQLSPADYYLAREVVGSLSINDSDDAIYWFHIVIALGESLRQGHTCLPISALANTHIGYHVDEGGIVTHQGFIFPSIETLTALVSSTLDETQEQLLIHYDGNLYLRRYFLLERELSESLNAFNQTDPNVDLRSAKSIIDKLFAVSDDEVDWQKIAVANTLNKQFSVIAGGPGTGKTYTVTKLLAALIMIEHSNSLDIRLVAPTGKAAQRLAESIGAAVAGFEGQIDQAILEQIPSDAQTIHRLLGVIPNQVNFRHRQDNKLSADVVIIDEVSMVDLPLMTRLFRALAEHCKVIMLGDADQLPSVAAGGVLADLAPRPHAGFTSGNQRFLNGVLSQSVPLPDGRCDHLVFLNKSRRFDGSGGIGNLAKLVIAGDADSSWQLISDAENLDKSKQIAFQQGEINEWLSHYVQQYYKPVQLANTVEEAFEKLSNFRILCAMRAGRTGVEAINAQVQQLLGIDQRKPLYHGKPIMILNNDYNIGLYNGDIGIVWQDGNQLVAYFAEQDGSYKRVLPAKLPSYEAVYAMTIHKTQGSEFSHVLMVLPEQSNNQLLSRELLYTGITRAKANITIASDIDVWRQGVLRKVERYSGLSLD